MLCSIHLKKIWINSSKYLTYRVVIRSAKMRYHKDSCPNNQHPETQGGPSGAVTATAEVTDQDQHRNSRHIIC